MIKRTSFYALKLYTNLYLTIISITILYSNGLISIITHANVQQTRNITHTHLEKFTYRPHYLNNQKRKNFVRDREPKSKIRIFCFTIHMIITVYGSSLS